MKFAYLILAHNEPDVLRALVTAIDDSDNDIYILLDKKSKSINKLEILQTCKKAYIAFVPETNVSWGGEYNKC